MAERYEAGEIEPRWQAAWEAAGLFRAERDPSRPKVYVLEMFPYPSGRIHMGHVRNYTMGDLVARYKAARGFNVLHPMGWDAFGMPAENAAIEKGVHPATWTYQNIDAMRGQMQPLGLSIDWSREFATCDPEYYGRQQALFLDMLEAGLVARKAAVVNWDPVDMTVLANEQVIDGKGWRSGAPVERRELVQWFFRITDMADELLAAIDGLGHWPEKVRTMQRNWIGKSRGLQFRFETKGAPEGFETLEVFTTRPDTLWGATFAAVAPDHPLARALAAKPEVAAFRAEAAHLGTSEEEIETAEKRGIDTGVRVLHPLDPAIVLPVWIANFILMDYGTGAIFGCPAHDQRDLDFCRKYGLPVIDVFVPRGSEARVEDDRLRAAEGRGGRLPAPGRGPRADDGRGGDRARDRLLRGARRRRGRREVPAARLGDLAAALLGLPDPGAALPGLRRGARGAREPAGTAARRRELRPSGQPARVASDLDAGDLPALRRRGAARDRHDGHLRRLRAGTSRASPRRTPRRRPTSPTPTTG